MTFFLLVTLLVFVCASALLRPVARRHYWRRCRYAATAAAAVVVAITIIIVVDIAVAVVDIKPPAPPLPSPPLLRCKTGIALCARVYWLILNNY